MTEWGMRSYQDEPDSTRWGGQNVFDVYTTFEGTALDGTKYRTGSEIGNREMRWIGLDRSGALAGATFAVSSCRDPPRQLNAASPSSS